MAGLGLEEGDVLRLAAGVEADSEHPLARAIVAAAKERAEVAAATGFRSIPGRGVEATIDGQRYAVGGPALLRQRGLDVPVALRPRVEEWQPRGAAVLYLLREDGIVGALAAGALEWAGVTLPPAVAAVLMSASTIVVAANAQLLRRLDLRPAAAPVA